VSPAFKRPLPCVEVVVEPGTLERTPTGGIAGRIWLRDGSREVQADFPEVGWSDSPVALLGAWGRDLQRLARVVPSEGATARCRFIGGPYSFTVLVERTGVWRISCTEERSTGGHAAAQSWVTDASSFLDGLYRAIRATLAACDARGWWSDETETLRRLVEGVDQVPL
jgi:hypothetical protein